MLLSSNFTVELHKKVCCFKCEHTFQAWYLSDCVSYLSFLLDILWLNCTNKCAALSVTNVLKLAILTKLLHTTFIIFIGGISLKLSCYKFDKVLELLSTYLMVELTQKVCYIKCEHHKLDVWMSRLLNLLNI